MIEHFYMPVRQALTRLANHDNASICVAIPSNRLIGSLEEEFQGGFV